MDDRREEIERIRSEIEGALAAGTPVDLADWLRRRPDLQPELGERLGDLLGGAATLGPSSADPSSDLTVARIDPLEPTVVAGSPADPTVGQADPDAPTALAPPPTPVVDPSARTVAMPGSPPVEPPDSQAATRLGDPTGAFDPHAARTGLGAPPIGGRSPGLPPANPIVRYIGDYELLNKLGEGGMGVVFRARQVSLKRMVALKMIRNSSFASEDHIRRFQNEAEAVATLDHEGIVPIYEVGTHEDQRYFSMKLIDGRAMDKALVELKADPFEAARIVAEIADAVHHAHQRGILHRDLKPANILLDRQGHAHVTDFGLAKRIEAEDGMTVPGTVLGTPAYMSPEQALGETSAVTTASDVYGIGAILFAALTNRAPFVGDSVFITLDRVRNNPPDPPRRLNPGAPRDLEVICLKCLEKDPRRRYGSASDLAEDLRRWLRHEPITARPVGPLIRLGMWARRKPAMASLTAALVLASILGVAGIAWQWREAVYQRDRAIDAEVIARRSRDEAIRQEQVAREAEVKAAAARDAALASEKAAVAARAEAEKNAQVASMQAFLALQTIQQLISRVVEKLDRPGLFDLKTDIIKVALRQVEAVAGMYVKDVTNKEATRLAAMLALGDIYRQTGQVQRAVPIFQESLEVARARLIIRKSNSSSRKNLAAVYRELADCAEQLDRDMNAVVANLKEALLLYEDMLARPTTEDPSITPAWVRTALADTYAMLGTAYHHLGDIPKAVEEYRRSFNLYGELLTASKSDPKLIRAAAFSAMTLADSNYRLGRREPAEDYLHQASDLLQQLAKDNPNDPKSRSDLGIYHSVVGRFRFWAGDLEAARREYEQSRDLLAGVARDDERSAFQRTQIVLAISRLGQLADSEKKPELARREYDEAVRLARQNLQVDEKNDLRRIDLMLLLPHVGQYARAVEIADRLAAGPKVDPELAIYLAQAYAQSARVLPPEEAGPAQGLLGKAVDQVRQAIRKGFRDRTILEREPDLEPIRGRADFKALLGELPPPG